jgi:hypothetical protein
VIVYHTKQNCRYTIKHLALSGEMLEASAKLAII